MKRVPKPRIIERKLGKEQAWGIATHNDIDRRKSPTIEVDPRLSPRRQIEVFCHEALHIALPDLVGEAGEREIDRLGKAVADVLWRANYRRLMLTKHTTPVKISKPRKKKK